MLTTANDEGYSTSRVRLGEDWCVFLKCCESWTVRGTKGQTKEQTNLPSLFCERPQFHNSFFLLLAGLVLGRFRLLVFTDLSWLFPTHESTIIGVHLERIPQKPMYINSYLTGVGIHEIIFQ